MLGGITLAIVIGLTGGIATGKSTVSYMFKQLGIPVVDTDKIAFNILLKGSETYFTIIHHFGQDILFLNGEINRKKLAQIMYYDIEKRKLLNSIVHPKVLEVALEEIKRYKEEKYELIVVDVPLLFETGFNAYVDKTLVVYTNYEDQIERLIHRDLIHKEYAIQKIASQMPLAEKVKHADYVIDNSFSILDTKKEFNKIIKELGVK